MPQGPDLSTLARAVATPARVRQARARIDALAGRVADPERGELHRAALNDAYLRLQFGLVLGDVALVAAQLRDCGGLIERILAEGRTGPAAEGSQPPGVGPARRRDAPQ